MSNETPLPVEQPTSARAFRQGLKQTQAHDAHLRLYQSFGQQLFDDGWSTHTAEHLLHTLCSLLSAQHALLAIENAGKLLVYSQTGQTLPTGARIPMMGILAIMLKHPVRFALQENKNTQLWTHGLKQHHECLIPLASGQYAAGIMAFSGAQLMLQEAEIQTLQSIAGMVALAISQHQEAGRSEADQSILATLTPREREILALLPSGLSNNQLGEKLGIAPGTAKIHVERVLSKLGVKDRTQAAVKAVELGYKA